MKLSKEAAKRHKKALDLVHSDKPLTWEERLFVLENFHESATHMNSLAGAFFTPFGLARDLSIEVPGGRVIDLCAGIGMLSFACQHSAKELVCVELNPDYLAAGKRIVPEAEWINASVFELPDLGRFDCAISNPPFGNIQGKWDGEYTGSKFEFKVIEVASRIADFGAFIIPQGSAPFRYSGKQCYSEQADKDCQKFIEQTGISMSVGCGIDTSIYRDEWKGVNVVCEVVCCEFEAPEAIQAAVEEQQLDLFGEAA